MSRHRLNRLERETLLEIGDSAWRGPWESHVRLLPHNRRLLRIVRDSVTITAVGATVRRMYVLTARGQGVYRQLARARLEHGLAVPGRLDAYLADHPEALDPSCPVEYVRRRPGYVPRW